MTIARTDLARASGFLRIVRDREDVIAAWTDVEAAELRFARLTVVTGS